MLIQLVKKIVQIAALRAGAAARTDYPTGKCPMKNKSIQLTFSKCARPCLNIHWVAGSSCDDLELVLIGDIGKLHQFKKKKIGRQIPLYSMFSFRFGDEALISPSIFSFKRMENRRSPHGAFKIFTPIYSTPTNCTEECPTTLTSVHRFSSCRLSRRRIMSINLGRGCIHYPHSEL